MHLTPARRSTRAASAVLGTLLLGAGLAGPAQAERYVHRDPSRDVQRASVLTMDGDGFHRAPHRRQGDVVKVKVWHQVRTVRVVTRMRRLDPVGQGVMQVVSIRTPAAGTQDFTVVAGPGFRKGVDDDTAGRDCVVGHHVNYARNRFSMRISRDCLGSPLWVRVGVGVVTVTRRSVTADDAQRRGIRDELTYSPRLVHGTPR